MPQRWQAALLDNAAPGGWVLAHCQQGFLSDVNGVLFPREWLKRQELSILAEHGLGHFAGEPVYLLELQQTLKNHLLFTFFCQHSLYMVRVIQLSQGPRIVEFILQCL